MHPLVGLNLSGASLTPVNDLPPGRGVLGRPVWGPGQLLGDLELRLGLETPSTSDALRIMRWASRMAALAKQDTFYTRSFELDRLGTAQGLLAMRDNLVEAGWDGEAIADGGARLATIAELESIAEPELPPSQGDRLRAAAAVLETYPTPIYESLTIAESAECWPALWRRVFTALQLAGTRLQRMEVKLPGASAESDLGKLQRALGVGAGSRLGRLRGDGSLMLLTAETSVEAARAAAALLAREEPRDCVVIRGGEQSVIEHALRVQGLPLQGLHSTSPWRAAQQVLPLALELAFAPKDPTRAYELLGLPRGPFAGAAARRLMRALARAPGIGGRPWLEAKQRLFTRQPELEMKIALWFEQPGADPNVGASTTLLLEVVERVQQWLASQIERTEGDASLLTAHRQCADLVEALDADTRSHLDLVAVRRLTELVVGIGSRAGLTQEQAGRIDHVANPAALWAPRKTVVWWSFHHAYEHARQITWRTHEVEVLAKHGVRLPAPGLLLAERAAGWRRSVWAASHRLILVAPRTHAGKRLSPHPLWDEVVARAGDSGVEAAVTQDVDALLDIATSPLPLEAHEPLVLPGGHASWRVELASLPDVSRHSPHSLSELLGCPFRWALGKLAHVESERSALPPMYVLSGTLGHRLVEELHTSQAFHLEGAEFEQRAERLMDELFQREGSVLFMAGKGNERVQVGRQLVNAVLALKRTIDDNKLRIIAVEQDFEIPWQGGLLTGRFDLLLENNAGERLIIDLKWGQRSYREMLESGQAIQLAAYSHALSQKGESVDAAYYSLKGRRVLALSTSRLHSVTRVNGPDLSTTWKRVERSLPLAQRAVQSGTLPVVGLSTSNELLASFGLTDDEFENHYASDVERTCQHCAFDALCGRRWERQDTRVSAWQALGLQV